jgi:hypothetical protein
MGTDELVHPTRLSGVRVKVFAFEALASLAPGVSYAGHQAYRAATDSFVAPIILSPDSDVVLEGKLQEIRIAAERSHVRAVRAKRRPSANAFSNLIVRAHSPGASRARSTACTEGVSA